MIAKMRAAGRFDARNCPFHCELPSSGRSQGGPSKKPPSQKAAPLVESKYSRAREAAYSDHHQVDAPYPIMLVSIDEGRTTTPIRAIPSTLAHMGDRSIPAPPGRCSMKTPPPSVTSRTARICRLSLVGWVCDNARPWVFCAWSAGSGLVSGCESLPRGSVRLGGDTRSLPAWPLAAAPGSREPWQTNRRCGA